MLTNNALSSAWLVNNKEHKFLLQLTQKNLEYIVNNNVETYNNNKTLELELAYEYGIRDDYNLVYSIKSNKSLFHKFYVKSPIDRSYSTEINRSNSFLPNQFKSHSLSIKKSLYKNLPNIISYELGLTHFKHNKFALDNKIMYGKSWPHNDLYNFYEISASYQKSLNAYEDIFKVESAYGYYNKKNILYMIELSLYNQLRLYDINGKRYNPGKYYKEAKLQLSRIHKLNKDNIFLREGIFFNLNNRKHLRSYGMVLSMWFTL